MLELREMLWVRGMLQVREMMWLKVLLKLWEMLQLRDAVAAEDAEAERDVVTEGETAADKRENKVHLSTYTDLREKKTQKTEGSPRKILTPRGC